MAGQSRSGYSTDTERGGWAMSIVYGTFEDMAIFYLKELAKWGEETPVLFCKMTELTYGVCTGKDFADMIVESGYGVYRPVSAASPDEFMGLLIARYRDFFGENQDAKLS